MSSGKDIANEIEKDCAKNDLNQLEDRFRNLILNTCNVVGCEDCILKWPGGCMCDEIQGKIMDLELAQDETKGE